MSKSAKIALEFKRSWRVVFAALIGSIFGIYGLSFYAFGVFIGPLTRAFGWSLSAVTGWIVFWSLGQMVVQPFVGLLADRFGARRVVIVSLPLFALALAAASVIEGKLWLFYMIALATGCLGTGVSFLTYGRVVNGWFDAGRGTALGVMTAGIGISAIFGPRLMQTVVDGHGWRAGFLFLAAVALLALTVVIPWLHERREPVAQRSAWSETGYTLKEALHVPVFWLIALAFFLYNLALGANVDLIPFLSSSGLSRADAATLAGLLGIFSVFGNLLIGTLIDRFHVAAVYAFALLAHAVAFAALGVFQATYATAAVAVIGFSMGGEAACGGYCIARYFGIKSYGQLYGLLGIAIGTGIGLGPVAFSRLQEITGKYDASFSTFAVALAVSAGLFALIARYPFFREHVHQQRGAVTVDGSDVVQPLK